MHMLELSNQVCCEKYTPNTFTEALLYTALVRPLTISQNPSNQSRVAWK